jgi:L-malate glycosyltransferase
MLNRNSYDMKRPATGGSKLHKRLKILIVNYEFPPLGGGGGVATWDLAIEWVKGAEVHVLTSWFKGLPFYEEVKGIHVHRARIVFRKSRDVATFVSMLSYLVFGFFKGMRLCGIHRFDVINTHFAVPSGPLGYVLSKLFRIPNVLSLHGGDIYDPSKKISPHQHWFFKRAVRFILNRADRIVAQSSNTRDNAVAYYSPVREVSIIPLAFHPPRVRKASRAELGIGRDEFVLITIGRLIKRKAIDTMINALAKLPDKNITLYIMGDGPEREFLSSLADQMGLRERVIFLGYVDDEEKYRYLSVTNLFVSTSLHEGFGIVFMEAMHFGIPIVCSNYGGQVDFLADGENALLIDVGDATACASSVKRFLKDRVLYARCARNNMKKVRDFYADAVARRYMDIFIALSSKGED